MNPNATPTDSPRAQARTHSLTRNRQDICDDLTDAQLRVLMMLLDGKSAPQIKAETGRSINTAHDHIKAIYRKLDVNNRVQLVRKFMPAGGGT